MYLCIVLLTFLLSLSSHPLFVGLTFRQSPQLLFYFILYSSLLFLLYVIYFFFILASPLQPPPAAFLVQWKCVRMAYGTDRHVERNKQFVYLPTDQQLYCPVPGRHEWWVGNIWKWSCTTLKYYPNAPRRAEEIHE